MKHINTFLLILILSLMTSLTGCSVIGDIFNAGLWTGIIIVAVVVVVVILIVRRFRN